MLLHNEVIMHGIRRQDIVKCDSLEHAEWVRGHTRAYSFIFLGNSDDARPYWVVDAHTAEKLERYGYERA